VLRETRNKSEKEELNAVKKILCILCTLTLVLSLLAACGKNNIGVASADALHRRDFEFSTDWPENEFSSQIPKPQFETALEDPSETEYSIVCDATVDQLKEYVEILKAAGFTKDESTTEENAFSVIAYKYSARNEEGYTVEANFSNALGSLATVTVRKSA